jgi:hypothetical protein
MIKGKVGLAISMESKNIPFHYLKTIASSDESWQGPDTMQSYSNHFLHVTLGQFIVYGQLSVN